MFFRKFCPFLNNFAKFYEHVFGTNLKSLFSFPQVHLRPLHLAVVFFPTLFLRAICVKIRTMNQRHDKAGFSSGRLSSHQSRNGWNILAGKNWQKKSGSGWSSIAVLGPHFIYIFWLVTNFLWLFGHVLNELWVKLLPQSIFYWYFSWLSSIDTE